MNALMNNTSKTCAMPTYLTTEHQSFSLFMSRNGTNCDIDSIKAIGKMLS